MNTVIKSLPQRQMKALPEKKSWPKHMLALKAS